MTDHNQTPTTAQVRRNQLPLPNGDSREVNLAEFDRWLAAHDAELTERVRAEQREADAQIAEDAAIGWNHDYDNGCFDASAAIREARKQ